VVDQDVRVLSKRLWKITIGHSAHNRLSGDPTPSRADIEMAIDHQRGHGLPGE
jgi:DNA repair protein RadC